MNEIVINLSDTDRKLLQQLRDALLGAQKPEAVEVTPGPIAAEAETSKSAGPAPAASHTEKKEVSVEDIRNALMKLDRAGRDKARKLLAEFCGVELKKASIDLLPEDRRAEYLQKVGEQDA